MKPIKTLLLLVAILCSNSIWAEEVVIKLQCENNNKNRVKDDRSITLEPTATIDGNTIRIYTDVAISNLHASIKDRMGNIVYSNEIAHPSKCHVFELSDLAEGDFSITLFIGTTVYYGYFSIL